MVDGGLGSPRLLLRRPRVDVNCPDLVMGNTALHYRWGVVWWAMVWYGTVWYGTVRYGMVWYGMVRYGMVQYGMVWYGTSLPLSAGVDNVDSLKLLVAHPTITSLNTSNNMGFTPLMSAVFCGGINCVKELVGLIP